uniref:ATP-dependent RNA helicase n=1 Tax=Blastobotrys adeninivorans TaxID=409370 RepID=A0A060T2Q6_BLAAD
MKNIVSPSMFAKRFDPEDLEPPSKRLRSDESESSDSETNEERASEAVPQIDQPDGGEGSSSDSESSELENGIEDASEQPDQNDAHTVAQDDHEGEGEVIDPKFSGVFDRFRSTIKKFSETNFAKKQTEENEEEENDPYAEADLHDLVPLPVPEGLESQKKKNLVITSEWIKNRVYISPDEENQDFGAVQGLSPEMESLLTEKYQTAFPVQKHVIPELLKGVQSITPDPLSDILIQAHTGSGKTLVYGVGIVEALRKCQHIPRLFALVIVPTNPLTGQVRQVIEQLAKGTSISVAMIRTDRSFKEEQQFLARNKPNVIVTTPGRLVDHLHEGSVSLERLKYLVIDEADRLLNQSFQDWADVVIKSLPPVQDRTQVWNRPVQKLVFSATLTTDAGKLAPLQIRDPRLYIVGHKEDIEKGKQQEYTVPAGLREILVPIKSPTVKPLRLVQLLKSIITPDNSLSKVIIFVKDNESASRLARLVALINQEVFNDEGTLSIDKCSGEMQASQRKKVLRKFNQGEIRLLVCTDLVGRGIDIPEVDYVINYDLPITIKDYIHRVGRTARAGKTGTAWNLASTSDDHRKFKWISKRVLRPSGDTKVEYSTLESDQQDSDDVNEKYQRSLSRLEEEVFNRA